MQPSSSKSIGIIVAVVVILGVIATSIALDKKDTAVTSTAPEPVTTPTTTPVTTTKQPSDKPKTAYKNGTYSATGFYMSPGGPDKLNVTLTIANDVVTDATVTQAAGDNTSVKYQEKFISGYKQYVIGQKIDTLNLTKVSGASLTPIGFNDALAQIKVKAKA
jgi:hypothetical protein